MPIDEKEEFHEESQISLWETDKRNSNFISSSMNKANFQDKHENLFLDGESEKILRTNEAGFMHTKPKQLVNNPILGSDSSLLKVRSTNKVLEEENPGHMPKFHQQERDDDANFGQADPRLRKNLSAVRTGKNKGESSD